MTPSIPAAAAFLSTGSWGGAGEGAQLRISPENDSNGILAQVLSEAHSGDWIAR